MLAGERRGVLSDEDDESMRMLAEEKGRGVLSDEDEEGVCMLAGERRGVLSNEYKKAVRMLAGVKGRGVLLDEDDMCMLPWEKGPCVSSGNTCCPWGLHLSDCSPGP
jgi:hypothetical protein